MTGPGLHFKPGDDVYVDCVDQMEGYKRAVSTAGWTDITSVHRCSRCKPKAEVRNIVPYKRERPVFRARSRVYSELFDNLSLKRRGPGRLVDGAKRLD